MDKYIAYMHVSPSNKRYIGITMQDAKLRWKNGRGYSKNKYFTNAINKYGWDNFKHIIIAKGLSKEEACWLEIELIREWDSANRSKGYNITFGGEGTSGHNPREGKTEEELKEWDEKKRRARQETWDNKTEDELKEWKNNLSKNHADFKGEKHPMWGRRQSEEAKNNMSKHKIGKYTGSKSYQAKKVICLNTLKIFDCIKEIVENEEYSQYKISTTNISNVCKNTKRKEYDSLSTGTLPTGEKLTWMYYDDYLKASKEEIEEKIKRANRLDDKFNRFIICLNTLKIYKNMQTASDEMGVDRTSISKCCDHHRKSAGKLQDGTRLIWMRLEEFLKNCIIIKL